MHACVLRKHACMNTALYNCTLQMQDEDMAMADTYDAGLFEGDIALTVEDIAEMNDLDMVSSHTATYANTIVVCHNIVREISVYHMAMAVYMYM